MSLRAPAPGLAAWAVVLAWIPAVLWLDRDASTAGQLALGAVTWLLLIWFLAPASSLVRVQVLVVVAFATAVEYVFSGWLGVYEYRLDQVPAYVPPGHGLVYVAALGFGAWLAGRPSAMRVAVAATVCIGGAAAVWGLAFSSRPDALGAFWFVCLAGFLLWGRNRGLYVGAFIVVTWLEVLGTAWGVWTWMPQDTILGIVSIGNPPSVAAGGYGWFDLAAVAAAPALLAGWAASRGWLLARWSTQEPEHLLVQETVGGHAAAGAESR